MKGVLAIVLTCAYATAIYAVDDERIFIDAKVNGKPVRLAFDTGTSIPFILYSTAAQKLNLKVTPPPADARIGPGQTRIGWTAVQELDLGFANFQTSFGVVEIPPSLKTSEDGMMGWPAVTNNILSLNCIGHTISLFTNTVENFNGWVECHLETNSDLTLGLPRGKNPKEIIALDSGSTDGVRLNPHNWREWKATHTNQPMTMEAYYTPGAGLVVTEEAWADKISLGRLTLTDVPVTQADSSDIALHSSPQTQFEATLGLAAMKRLDIILDGKHGLTYLRPKDVPPMPYEYNHLGAVFVPKDLQGGDLIAHVINGSPALEAGICDGDILLKMGNLDCTKWRIDPNVLSSMHLCLNSPAETKLEFTLKRGDKIFTTTAVLRNILPPDSTKN